MNPRASRGFLNNNPGNVDRSAEIWQGEIRDPADQRLTAFQRDELVKGRFCVFLQPQLGIRMLAKTLFAYRDRLGRRTVRQIINTWAPPNENDTGAYVNVVAGKVGVSPDAEIDVRDYKTLRALVSAIIVHECGGMPYSGGEIEDGLMLAGVAKPVGVTTSRTATSLTVASGATMAGGGVAVLQETTQPQPQATVPAPAPEPDLSATVTAVQEPLRQAADGIAPFADTSAALAQALFWIKIALTVIAIAGIAVAAWERVKRARRDSKMAALQADVVQSSGGQ